MYPAGRDGWFDEILEFNWEIGTTGTLMKLAGLWPYSGLCGNLIFSINLLLLLITIPSTSVSLFRPWKNEGIIYCLVALYEICVALRYCVFRSQKSKLRKIFNIMKINWIRARYLNPDRRKIIQKHAKQSRCVSWTLSIGFILLAIGFLPFPWIIARVTEKPVRLPVDTWYPFSIEESPISEIIFILHYIAFGFLVLFACCIESCNVIIINHCCAQVRVLCMMIDQHDGRIQHLHDLREDHDARRANYNCSCTKCIVDTHVEITHLFRLIKDVFSSLTTVAMMIAFIHCGIIVLVFSMRLKHDSLLFYGFYYSFETFIMSLTLLYCWLGQKIKDESRNISAALFHSDWAFRSHGEKTSLTIMVTYAAHNPMILMFASVFRIHQILFRDIIIFGYTFLIFCKTLADFGFGEWLREINES